MSLPFSSSADNENTGLTARLTALDSWIDKQAANSKLSGAFLYARDGQVLYEKAVGLHHPDKPGANGVASSFNLASVSKHFTATAIMLLAHRGALEYDQPVKRYLPLFPYENITVRHLLNHTSGLSDYMELTDRHWTGDLFTNQALTPLYHRHRPALAFSPGSRYEYSNTGYVLLAAIVEEITELSYEQFMQENVFTPLALHNTAVVNLLSDPDSLQSRVYGQFEGKLYDLNELDGVTGDGGVYSSVRDLLAWHTALLNGSLLPASMLKEATKPARLSNGQLSYYGFGWELFEDKPHAMQHSGSWVGFNTYMIRNTATNALLVLLTNDASGIEIDTLIPRFFDAVGPDGGL
ncbi:MAG: serine hydrolase domain-containing protein [Pseudomonadota bacterium]